MIHGLMFGIVINVRLSGRLEGCGHLRRKHRLSWVGITGFTLPTMYRWINSEFGRSMTLHPFQKGHYLGSGQADMVLAEAGLDGKSQFKSIMKYLKEKRS